MQLSMLHVPFILPRYVSVKYIFANIDYLSWSLQMKETFAKVDEPDNQMLYLWLVSVSR